MKACHHGLANFIDHNFTKFLKADHQSNGYEDNIITLHPGDENFENQCDTANDMIVRMIVSFWAYYNSVCRVLVY